ncbi:MAG: phosphate acetyltransferase [Halanaerobiaceae bacterium]
MDLERYFKNRAAKQKKTIVLPETEDRRTIIAASRLLSQKITDVILLGEKSKIETLAREESVEINQAKFINPKNSELISEFADIFYELRKHKNITREEALNTIKNPLYFGTMLVHTDKAQGMVAGAVNLTSDVLRPSFQIIKTKENFSIVSGAFIMDVPDSDYGSDGLFVFADSGVNPNPDSKQLAEIAISSAQTARDLLEKEPVVALLSFSTKGSAKHELVEKVKKATKIAQKKAPELLIDGELQADTALVPEVAAKKAPESKIAGKANVLIFPDLQAGNIGYKLVQRLAGADAFGPILQGIAKPVNDLSRGCSVNDIVNVAAITAIQANY